MRYPSERTNCDRLTGAMLEFSSFIEEMEMVDPLLCGGSFTWRKGEIKLTDFYCSEWGDSFTQIKFKAVSPKLLQIIILLCCPVEMMGGASYFKFEAWWLEVEGF